MELARIATKKADKSSLAQTYVLPQSGHRLIQRLPYIFPFPNYMQRNTKLTFSDIPILEML